MEEVARRLDQSLPRPPWDRSPGLNHNSKELIQSVKRASSDENTLSDHQQTLSKILNRARHTSERTPASGHFEVLAMDTRWASSEALPRDMWRLASSSSVNFLDTKPRVFGSKTVFLIDRKVPKSESDRTLSQTMAFKAPSRSSTLYLSTPV